MRPSTRRRPTPTPPDFGLGQPATSPPAVRLARLAREHAELTALILPRPEPDWRRATNGMPNAMHDLDRENAYGVHAGTPLTQP